MMKRQIGLSNLSLLPWSIFWGPEKTWAVAREAGFDGLKVNPLRGWHGVKIHHAEIPVLAFEAPWRNSFKESLGALLQGDVMGFVADTVFFGSGADERAMFYKCAFPQAIGVDCPPHYRLSINFVRETDFQKWPGILDTNTPVCLDTWHIRNYQSSIDIFGRLINSGRIKTIDVQIKNYTEVRNFLAQRETTLEWQLSQLARLPQSVNASLELLPQHLWKLQREFSLTRNEILHYLQARIRQCLK